MTFTYSSINFKVHSQIVPGTLTLITGSQSMWVCLHLCETLLCHSIFQAVAFTSELNHVTTLQKLIPPIQIHITSDEEQITRVLNRYESREPLLVVIENIYLSTDTLAYLVEALLRRHPTSYVLYLLPDVSEMDLVWTHQFIVTNTNEIKEITTELQTDLLPPIEFWLPFKKSESMWFISLLTDQVHPWSSLRYADVSGYLQPTHRLW